MFIAFFGFRVKSKITGNLLFRIFYKGIFYKGIFHKGIFHKGIFHKGIFHKNNFPKTPLPKSKGILFEFIIQNIGHYSKFLRSPSLLSHMGRDFSYSFQRPSEDGLHAWKEIDGLVYRHNDYIGLFTSTRYLFLRFRFFFCGFLSMKKFVGGAYIKYDARLGVYSPREGIARVVMNWTTLYPFSGSFCPT